MNTEKQLKYLTNPKILAEIDWAIQEIFELNNEIKETTEQNLEIQDLLKDLQYAQKNLLFLLDEIIDNIILNN